MRFLSDPRWVDKTPILTTLLLEAANVQQLVRMWSEGSAEGQSITGWLSVNVALLLWLNFYRVVTPHATWAIRGTLFGVVMNAAVILTVAWFQFLR